MKNKKGTPSKTTTIKTTYFSGPNGHVDAKVIAEFDALGADIQKVENGALKQSLLDRTANIVGGYFGALSRNNWLGSFGMVSEA